jgi:hypothetical protein
VKALSFLAFFKSHKVFEFWPDICTQRNPKV